MFSKALFLCAVVFVELSVGLFLTPHHETGFEAVRKAPRWNMPWLWMGMYCNGCPPRGCEDDEAIIHGFCCGCAYHLGFKTFGYLSRDHQCGIKIRGHHKFCKNRLPIACPEFLQCPLNLHGLCHDYEYMMRCCC